MVHFSGVVRSFFGHPPIALLMSMMDIYAAIAPPPIMSASYVSYLRIYLYIWAALMCCVAWCLLAHHLEHCGPNRQCFDVKIN